MRRLQQFKQIGAGRRGGGRRAGTRSAAQVTRDIFNHGDFADTQGAAIAVPARSVVFCCDLTDDQYRACATITKDDMEAAAMRAEAHAAWLEDGAEPT